MKPCAANSLSSRDNGDVTNSEGARPTTLHELPKKDWHNVLDELTRVRVGDDITIELLDAEFGDELEAERMPLAYIEYDEHADQASVGVGGRDGRYPVVLRHSITQPTAVLTDTEPPLLPLTVQILAADGSETLVTITPRTEG